MINHRICLLCGPAISTFFSWWFWNPLPLNTFAWGRIQIVGGARCSPGQPELKLDSLSTSVEVCLLKRENVPPRCNIRFTLAIVTSGLHVRLCSCKWKESWLLLYQAACWEFMGRLPAATRVRMFRALCLEDTLKKSVLWRNRSWCLSVKMLERYSSVFRAWPAGVKLAAVDLSSSLVLAFPSLSPGPACFGSDSALVPQRYTSQINILYDGNIVWVCDKACQHRNEASWHWMHC